MSAVKTINRHGDFQQVADFSKFLVFGQTLFTGSLPLARTGSKQSYKGPDMENASTAPLHVNDSDAHSKEVDLLRRILRRAANTSGSDDLADRLIRRFGSLVAVLRSDRHRLRSEFKLQKASLSEIDDAACLLEATVRHSRIRHLEVEEADALKQYAIRALNGFAKEQFHCLYFNRRQEMIHHAHLQTGCLDHVTVYPRELLAHAFQCDASHLALMHNHPSGLAKPSLGDIRQTDRLAAICKSVGLELVDHLIVANGQVYSFKQEGHIGEPPSAFAINQRTSTAWRKQG